MLGLALVLVLESAQVLVLQKAPALVLRSAPVLALVLVLVLVLGSVPVLVPRLVLVLILELAPVWVSVWPLGAEAGVAAEVCNSSGWGEVSLSTGRWGLCDGQGTVESHL